MNDGDVLHFHTSSWSLDQRIYHVMLKFFVRRQAFSHNKKFVTQRSAYYPPPEQSPYIGEPKFSRPQLKQADYNLLFPWFVVSTAGLQFIVAPSSVRHRPESHYECSSWFRASVGLN